LTYREIEPPPDPLPRVQHGRYSLTPNGPLLHARFQFLAHVAKRAGLITAQIGKNGLEEIGCKGIDTCSLLGEMLVAYIGVPQSPKILRCYLKLRLDEFPQVVEELKTIS
jgi:hypothetical protein